MINLGIDFGSTYSLLTVYRRDNLESLHFDLGSPYVPSIVTYDTIRKAYDYGSTAKSLAGGKYVRTFNAFKMLLNAQMSKEELKKRGYDDENTPEEISYIFWKLVLEKVMKQVGDDHIGTVVIGVPEIWGSSFSTVDGRSAVRDIFKRFPFIDNVKVVSEPAAASAFFAYNYKNETGEYLNGSVLLVDYGGGTLDITLTKVSYNGEQMEIKVLDREGFGENFEGKVGNASILYMESLLKCAIAEAGVPEEEIELDNAFIRCRYKLEEILQQRVDIIDSVFESYGQTPDILEEIPLVEDEITYKKHDVVITYGQMYRIYKQEIEGVLEKALNKFKEKTMSHDNNFKIALVGGFGNFYLVRRQVYDKFNIISDDERISGIIRHKEDCEKAISLGAALLANDVVTIRETFNYSLGIYSTNADTGEIFYRYAININDEIQYDNTYMVEDNNGKNYVYMSSTGDLDVLLLNLSTDNANARRLRPKEHIAKKLKGVIGSRFKTALIGFSVDHSGLISIHVLDYDYINGSTTNEHIIELTTFKDMFDPTELEVSQ